MAQEQKNSKALLQVEKKTLFSTKDKLLYACGFVLFILGGPILMAYLSSWAPGSFLSEGPSTFYLGGFTSAVGLFFALWANYELVVKGRGGAGNFGNIKLMQETKHLVTTGPYSICRNPMHLGVFLYYTGFACALNSLVSLIVPVAVLCVAYIMAIFLDEPRLERDFPQEFAAYKAQVPRFMPKIFKSKR